MVGASQRAPRGADAKKISVHAVTEYIDEEGGDTLLNIAFGSLILTLLAVGFCFGMRVVPHHAELRAEQQTELHARRQVQLGGQLEASIGKDEEWTEKHQSAKWKRTHNSIADLKQACDEMNFHCGARAAK